MSDLLERCHGCRRVIGLDVKSIHGGVGPSLVRCRSCNAVMESGRMEWPRRSTRSRQRFTIRSIAIATVLGLLATLIAVVGHHFWVGVSPSGKGIGVIFLASASGYGAVQGLRIVKSLRRDIRGDIRPREVSLLSFESSPLAICLVPFAVALATLVVYRLTR